MEKNTLWLFFQSNISEKSLCESQNPFSSAFFVQVFILCLLCVKHWIRHYDSEQNKRLSCKSRDRLYPSISPMKVKLNNRSSKNEMPHGVVKA